MKMTRVKRIGLRVVAMLLIATTICGGLLCFPQLFFHWSVSAANLTLYSDQPFSPEAGKKVLEMTHAKLATSPLYSEQQHDSIFVCNARWRQRLFFLHHYGVGGVNYYPVTTNVFLRDALVENNQLISPSGNALTGDRTLDYFMAHEITHTLTGRAAGWYRHYNMPEWVREGYADYVGKGANSFNYSDAVRAFLADAPEMDRQKSGLYLRYHLLVAHQLDKEGWAVERLLQDPIDQKTVEEQIRQEQAR